MADGQGEVNIHGLISEASKYLRRRAKDLRMCEAAADAIEALGQQVGPALALAANHERRKAELAAEMERYEADAGDRMLDLAKQVDEARARHDEVMGRLRAEVEALTRDRDGLTAELARTREALETARREHADFLQRVGAR